MFEEFVIEHGPEQGPHSLGRAVDQMGLVDAVDQYDDSRIAQGPQYPLEFDEQFIAVVGALLIRERLAGDVGRREVH